MKNALAVIETQTPAEREAIEADRMKAQREKGAAADATQFVPYIEKLSHNNYALYRSGRAFDYQLYSLDELKAIKANIDLIIKIEES